MQLDKQRTVAFLHHLSSHSSVFISLSSNDPAVNKLQRRIDQAIANMIEDGFDTFLVPIDKDFGTLTAKALIKVKTHNPNIKFIACFEYRTDPSLSVTSDRQFSEICNQADGMLFASEIRTPNTIPTLNNFILEQASGVVFCYATSLFNIYSDLHRAFQKKMTVITLPINP